MSNHLPQYPRVGISSCLLGNRVRYNGDHKKNNCILETLENLVEWFPVCPEVELGLQTPRKPIQLEKNNDTILLLGTEPKRKIVISTSYQKLHRSLYRKPSWVSYQFSTPSLFRAWFFRRNLTRAMNQYSQQKIEKISHLSLCGFIFKSKSPSCGLQTPVYLNATETTTGMGLFAHQFCKSLPDIPTIEETSFTQKHLQEHFLSRVFSLHRWNLMLQQNPTYAGLLQFHKTHKLLLLSFSTDAYRKTGSLLGQPSTKTISELQKEYKTIFFQGLATPTNAGKETNVLLHMFGYFKKVLSSEEKQNILSTITSYHQGQIEKEIPLSLLYQCAKKYHSHYLLEQLYFSPYPSYKKC